MIYQEKTEGLHFLLVLGIGPYASLPFCFNSAFGKIGLCQLIEEALNESLQQSFSRRDRVLPHQT